MGKQWLLYKFTSDGGAGGCNGTGKTSSSAGKSTKAAGKYSRKASNHHMTTSSSSSSCSSGGGGCMSAIFHMFDVHHFPFHQPSSISDSFVNIPQETNLILQGVEAPRNSLELDEEQVPSSSSSSSSKPKQDTNLNLPMAGIQIKTKRSRFLMMDDVSSESSTTSPATKTPNVVARLMGLDLLPENSSPRTSSSSPRPSSSSTTSYQTPLNPLSKLSSRNHQTTTHSLPATPRMSTADHHHHRLSLQMNKENSDYAKEIAKQVRENISRRVGGDITNTIKKKEEIIRRDQCLVVLKPKRRPVSPPAVMMQAATQAAVLKENEPGGSFSSNSCVSPRVRLLEIKNNTFKKPISNSPLSTPVESIKPPSPPPLMMKDFEKVEMVKKDESTLKKVKIGSEKYDLRLKKKHQEEEGFVKECKKKIKKKESTPLSNGLVNVNTRRKFISFKKVKEMASSSPSSTTPTLSQKQVPLALDSIQHLPRCQSHHQSHITKDDNYPNGNTVTVTTAVTGGPIAGNDYNYISRIFTHIGIDQNTPISIAHWYSPSHPLHPSTFHHLEQQLLPPTTTTTTTAAAAGNHRHRKLIFEAVDEVLVEILKPYIGFKPWAGSGYWSTTTSGRMYGWELVETVCRKIRSFPAADCRVLDDIDGLIAGDLKGSTRVVGTIAFEEEAEEIVKEMEREMVEMLVDEVAAAILLVG